MQIGQKIRALRKEKGLSACQLAKIAQISPSLLSRIENDQRSGTFNIHSKIANALNINIFDLYKDFAKEKESIYHGNLRSKTDTFIQNNTATFNVLTKDVFSKKMAPILLKIEPGGQSIAEQFKDGSERFLIVLEGKVEVHINNEVYKLLKHNFMYLDSSLLHFIVNVGKKLAKVVCITTPVNL